MFRKIIFNFIFLVGLIFVVGNYNVHVALSGVGDDLLPQTPSAVKATKIDNGSKVKIEWGNVTDVFGYDVMRTENQLTPDAEDLCYVNQNASSCFVDYVIGVDSNSVNDSGFDSRKSYFYKVRAISLDGVPSLWSEAKLPTAAPTVEYTTFDSMTPPAVGGATVDIVRGAGKEFILVFKNTGNVNLSKDTYFLTENSSDLASWRLPSEGVYSIASDVPPGGVVSFKISLKAPEIKKTYLLQWQMARRDVAGKYVKIGQGTPDYLARVIDQPLPPPLAPIFPDKTVFGFDAGLEGWQRTLDAYSGLGDVNYAPSGGNSGGKVSLYGCPNIDVSGGSGDSFISREFIVPKNLAKIKLDARSASGSYLSQKALNINVLKVGSDAARTFSTDAVVNSASWRGYSFDVPKAGWQAGDKISIFLNHKGSLDSYGDHAWCQNPNDSAVEIDNLCLADGVGVCINLPPRAVTGLARFDTPASGGGPVKLSWDVSVVTDKIDGYKIYRSGTLVATISLPPVSTIGSKQAITHTDLTLSDSNYGQTYYYKVLAYNNGGDSPASQELEVKTTKIVPYAPTPSLKSRFDSNIELSWPKMENAISYEVIRGLISGLSSTRGLCISRADKTSTCSVALSTGDTFISDTIPDPSKIFYYRVVARDILGRSSDAWGSANEVKISPIVAPTPTPAPSAPATAPTVSGGANGTPVSITALLAVTGATGYRVYRSTVSDFTTGVLVGGNPAILPISDTPAPGTYYYKYLAFNATGPSPLSPATSAVVVTALPLPPQSPIVTATASGRVVNVAWTIPSSAPSSVVGNTPKYYQVVRSVSEILNGFSNCSVSLSSSYFEDMREGTLPCAVWYSNNSALETIPDDGPYYYFVRPLYDNGNGGYVNGTISLASSFVVVPPPLAPASLTAVVDSPQTTSLPRVTLTWVPSAGAVKYALYRKLTNSTGDPTLLRDNVSSPHVDSGLANDTSYTYAVKAADIGSWSPSSSEVSVATPPTRQSQSISITATVTGNKVDFSWTVPFPPPAGAVNSAPSYYKLFRTTSSSLTTSILDQTNYCRTFTDSASRASTQWDCNIIYYTNDAEEALPDTGTYYYYVRAVYENGSEKYPSYGPWSQPSVPLTTVLPPLAPGIPDLSDTSDTGSSGTDDITNDDTPTFGVSCFAGSMVKLYEGETELASGTCLSSGTVSLTSIALLSSATPHSITAKQANVTGDTSMSSGVLSVRIDALAPDTTITASSQPANPTTSASANFSFTSSETISTFECKLDTGSFTTCATPKSYSALSSGSHTFSVRATDLAGNTDATPAIYTWVVESLLPPSNVTSRLVPLAPVVISWGAPASGAAPNFYRLYRSPSTIVQSGISASTPRCKDVPLSDPDSLCIISILVGGNSVTNLPTTITSVNDNPRSVPDQTYHYVMVSGLNAGPISVLSNETTVTLPPAAPENLNAAVVVGQASTIPTFGFSSIASVAYAVDMQRVNLSWTGDGTLTSSYRIYRSGTPITDYQSTLQIQNVCVNGINSSLPCLVQATDFIPGTNSASDLNINSGQVYNYRMIAINKTVTPAVFSLFSNATTAILAPMQPGITAVLISADAVLGTNIKLDIVEPASGTPTSYRLYRSDSVISSVPSTAPDCVDSGAQVGVCLVRGILANGDYPGTIISTNDTSAHFVLSKTYYYAIAAVNTVGGNDAISILSPNAFIQMPSVPSDAPILTLDSVGAGIVNLYWTLTQSATYEVMRSTAQDATTPDGAIACALSSSASCLFLPTPSSAITFTQSIPDLTKTYYYRVRAITSVGNTNWSAPVEVSTPEVVLSSIGVTGITSSSARIDWSTDRSSDTNVYYSIISPVDTSEPPGFYRAGGVSTHSASLSGLTPSARYYYVAKSTDFQDSSISGSSPELSFTTAAAPVLSPALSVSVISETTPPPIPSRIIAPKDPVYSPPFVAAHYLLDARLSETEVSVTSFEALLNAPSSILSQCGVFNEDGSTILSSFVSSSSGFVKFTFLSPIIIPLGGTKTLTLKCSISISASDTTGGSYSWGLGSLVDQATNTTDGLSFNPVNIQSSGQIINVGTMGNLQVFVDKSSLVANRANIVIPAEEVNVEIVNLRFTAEGEAIKLTKFPIKFVGQSFDLRTNPIFDQYTVWDGSTKVASGNFGLSRTFPNYSVVSLVSPVVVPKNGDKILTFKFDLKPLSTKTSSCPGKYPDTTDSGCKFVIDYSGRANSSLSAYGIEGVESLRDLYINRTQTTLADCNSDNLHNIDCDTRIEKVDPLHGLVIGPSGSDNVAAIDSSFNSIDSTISTFPPLSLLTIRNFNASAQFGSANLRNAEPRNIGSFRIDFPGNSLYSSVDCPFNLPAGDCDYLDTTHPSISLGTLYAGDTADTNLQNAIDNIPSTLNLLSPYLTYFEVAAPCPQSAGEVECPSDSRYFNVLQSPVGIALTVNDPAVINWKDVAIYQYIPVSSEDGVWLQVSDAVSSPSGQTVTFNATTDNQVPGYLLAILGVDNTPELSPSFISMTTESTQESLQTANIFDSVRGFVSRVIGGIVDWLDF
ncbi:MAG: hypothetical protein HZA94_03170 [Candidatus Vogelbacteria bacterium]|nr:hypothetical protein [Candidatus Vogelbacteria bacterium]